MISKHTYFHQGQKIAPSLLRPFVKNGAKNIVIKTSLNFLLKAYCRQLPSFSINDNVIKYSLDLLSLQKEYIS